MEVTKLNFEGVLPDFERLLGECEFYALDEEMTGINIPGVKDMYDEPISHHYANKRAVASRFGIIQVGVCLFVPAGDNYVAHPFNFYVFPESGVDIVLSASAISFNRKHGMDWSKWIDTGITYVNGQAEKDLRGRMFPDEGAEPKAAKAELTLQRPAEKEWFEAAWTAFTAWAEEERTPNNMEFKVPDVKGKFAISFFTQEVNKHYPALAMDSRPVRPGAWARNHFVLRTTAEEKADRERRAAEQKEADFARKVGARRIFTLLAESKKPFVGHNCWYDILFLMAALDEPLAETFEEWKARTHELFPVMYDTKVLALQPAVKDRLSEGTALENMYLTLTEMAKGKGHAVPVLPLAYSAYRPEVLGSTTAAGSRAHEAAYDAYITGCSFIILRRELNEAGAPTDTLSNTLYAMHSLYRLKLDGEDPVWSKSVVCLQDFDKSVDNTALQGEMKEHEGIILWVDDTCCIVCMDKMTSEEAFAFWKENTLGATVVTLDARQKKA